MKKRISVLLAICFIFLIGSPRAFAAKETAVSTKADLIAIASNLNGAYYLTTDLIFTPEDFAPGGVAYHGGALWRPIGSTLETAFHGTFDGRGHTISGLQVTIGDTAVLNGGLFGCSTGTIQNVTVQNSTFSLIQHSNSRDSAIYIGAVAGRNEGGKISNCKVEGCHVRLRGKGDVLFAYCGGVVGYSNGTLQNVSFSGSVEYETDYSFQLLYAYCGGIVGYAKETVTNAVHYGDVNCKMYLSPYYQATANYMVGGVAGFNLGDLKQCYNYGTVQSAYQESPTGERTIASHMGGLVGLNEGDLLSCANGGAVTLTAPNANGGSFFCAGLVGYNDAYGTLRRSADTGVLSDTVKDGRLNYAAGLVGCNTGQVTDCLSLGTVTLYAGGVAAGAVARNLVEQGAADDVFTDSGTVKRCIAYGTITALGTGRVSGFLGLSTDGKLGSLFCPYNIREGYAKPLSRKMLKDTQYFVDFDFQNTWIMSSTYEMPVLRNVPLFFSMETNSLSVDSASMHILWRDLQSVTLSALQAKLSTSMQSLKTTLPDGTPASADDTLPTGTKVGAYTLVVTGDVNADGYVDISDYSVLLSEYVSLKNHNYESTAYVAADIDGDGYADANDLYLLRTYLY